MHRGGCISMDYANDMGVKADIELVQEIMRRHPNATPYAWACALGWIHPTGRAMAWRVEQALLKLALECRVTKEGKKWRAL